MCSRQTVNGDFQWIDGDKWLCLWASQWPTHLTDLLEQNKWIWVNHWIIQSTDLFKTLTLSILGTFDLKHGYRRRSTRVAACSQGRSWIRTRQAGHFLLPLVTLTRCLHTLSQMKWIKCNICQIHRRFRNVFMSNRNTFYILLNTGPSVKE